MLLFMVVSYNVKIPMLIDSMMLLYNVELQGYMLQLYLIALLIETSFNQCYIITCYHIMLKATSYNTILI